MTSVVSRFFLRTFRVYAKGREVYNQRFHGGLNILRGDHAVGKSTLLDLIFHTLGGELRSEQWVYPANDCDRAVAEVEINGRQFCFSRNIEVGQIPPIDVFNGCFEDAINSLDGWQRYGARRSESKSSFSQLAFDLFGWDGYRTDEYSNLTMHQIFRLLYVDQETQSNKIFRAEPQNSDSESTRIAIAEFLLSLDDLQSHRARQKLLIANKSFEKANSELAAIFSVLGKDSGYREEDLNLEIEAILSDIATLELQRRDATEAEDEGTDESEHELGARVAELSQDMERIAQYISETEERLSACLGEIADCKAFHESIQFRKKSLQESEVTYKNLGQIEFKHCPSCKSEIAVPIDKSKCPLCKSSYSDGNLSESYLQMLTELNFQEKQNAKTINCLEQQLGSDKAKLNLANHELANKKALFRSTAGAISKREQLLVEISRKMGFAESQVAMLQEKVEIVQKVDRLRVTKSELLSEIGNLTELLEQLAAASAARRKRVLDAIGNTALEILEKDEQYEQVFSNASSLEAEIDFAKDRWLVDGRVKFSASSNVFKKNALHSAILAYSVLDKQCRHPRFMILDDIENGGMTAPRSRNFQKILAAMLSGKENDCQVIISTAMVDPTLDSDIYGVGPSYAKGDYVIKLR